MEQEIEELKTDNQYLKKRLKDVNEQLDEANNALREIYYISKKF